MNSKEVLVLSIHLHGVGAGLQSWHIETERGGNVWRTWMSCYTGESLVIRAVWWKKTSLQVEISFADMNLLCKGRDLLSIFRQTWRSKVFSVPRMFLT